MFAKAQTATQDREYRARLMLVESAFRVFSGLAIACDGELHLSEWAVLDEARLPEGRVHLGDLVAAISQARRRLLAGCPEIAATRLGLGV